MAATSAEARPDGEDVTGDFGDELDEEIDETEEAEALAALAEEGSDDDDDAEADDDDGDDGSDGSLEMAEGDDADDGESDAGAQAAGEIFLPGDELPAGTSLVCDPSVYIFRSEVRRVPPVSRPRPWGGTVCASSRANPAPGRGVWRLDAVHHRLAVPEL